MAAADRHKNDPENDPQPGDFAKLIKSLREHAGLSGNRASERTGVSKSRWAQVERGWETRRGMRVPAEPGPDFVLAVADAFDQDADDLLRVAGYDPEMVPRAPKTDLPPMLVMEAWPHLNPTQRRVVAATIRLFMDPNSVISNLDEPAETETAADTEASTAVQPPTIPPMGEPHTTRKRTRDDS
jgi:transcriptional regulator with XRE-family HTH domain